MSEDFFKVEYLIALPIYILVILGALFLHEMGHYIAARLFKIPIKDVVIGRGRLLKSWGNKHGIQWQIHLWPIGAHVNLTDINKRPFYQRMLTIMAGPLINVAIIPFLFFAFYILVGQPSIPNRAVGVERGLASEIAGIKPGDQFIAVDGIPLSNFDDMWRIAYSRGAEKSTYTIKRDDQTFDVAITPGWTEYQDSEGVPRKNARFGITWQHASFALKSILSVSGVPTKDDEDLARDLLIKSFDQPTWVEVKGPADELKPVLFNLSSGLNQGLLDEDDDNYDAVFFGTTPGNVYMQKTLLENTQNAFRYAAKLTKNIVTLPFQIFPIDKSRIRDSAAVTNPDTKIINAMYRVMHLFAVASILIGLINLLPFPNFDGGQIIDQILSLIYKEDVPKKLRAYVFAGAFAALYGTVFITNMDNLHGYIDSRLKKVHEFIDQKITNTDSEEN